ncbi:MAG: hypothetical protein V4850_05585 [Myxococcota bacterium]
MPLRSNLGDFSSIICFKAVVVGIEETLGVGAAGVALKSAGRKRGHALVESLGLKGARPEPAAIVTSLNAAVGEGGTRLCSIASVVNNPDGTFVVRLSETVCSAGEPQGSDRQLTFTLGALHGAFESLYGVKLRGKQTESVLRGGTHDTITLTPA